MVYSFAPDAKDGAAPDAPLLADGGRLYGTTMLAGTNRDGTIFSVTPSGTEKTLDDFSGSNGNDARAGLINVNGTFYGTTIAGGALGSGTVFTVTKSGKESVLYNFRGGSDDGSAPYSSLINVGGTLYGTTNGGGAYGSGTVFSLTPAGKETILHSFGGSGEDGRYPEAGLSNVDGTLYGTTIYGPGDSSTAGTVFSITTTGTETVLHALGGNYGSQPHGRLLVWHAKLYGTAPFGGAHGGGTVFSITTSGSLTVLHNFGGTGDGRNPVAGVIEMGGTLYGTTANGGAVNYGTVFALSP